MDAILMIIVIIQYAFSSFTINNLGNVQVLIRSTSGSWETNE